MLPSDLVNVPGLSYDLILGVLTSILSNFFMKCSLPNWSKQLVVLAVAVLAALARCYLTGSFTGTNISAAILLVLGVAYGSYETFLKDLGKYLQANAGVTDGKPTVATNQEGS